MTLLRTLFAAALVAVAAGGARADTRAAPPTPAAADAALDRALARLVALPGGPPGAIVLVQRGERLKVHSVGVGDLATGRPPRADDHVRIASVAKAFSGAAALTLVGRGLLSLDDTIGERAPMLPAAWSAITLRQLLGHTSGLPDFSQSAKFREAVFESLEEGPPPPALLDVIRGKAPTFEPGSRYRYSNTDNIVVALMVRRVLDKSYNEALANRVAAPLGLKRTTLPAGPEMPTPFIHGYDVSESPPEDLSEIIAARWSWASGGIVSTPADLNRFIRGYVGGALFGGATRAAQREVVAGGKSEPEGPGANSAGLALFRYETRCGTVWGHTGNTLGYTQFIAASDDGRRSVTFSINTQLTERVGTLEAFAAMREAEELAVCAALAR